jgi:hypothetical protein
MNANTLRTARLPFQRLVLLLIAVVILVPAIAGFGAPMARAGDSGARADLVGISGNAFPWESRWDQFQPLLTGTHAGWARVELRWEQINPSPNQWRFEHYDQLVDEYHEMGFEQLGLLAYSVGWASGQGGSQGVLAPPSDLDAWEAYVRRTVERYHDRVDAWEIWNEPDVALFWGGKDGGDPVVYLELLKRAHRAIKSVDPDATVMNGGLTGTERGANFLNRLLDLGGGKYLDVVAFHGYVASDSFDNNFYPEIIWPLISEARERSGKPLWFTEFGWASGCNSGSAACSETAQANRIARHLPMLFAIGGVERVFLFQFKDAGDNPDYFGLTHADSRGKAAYASFATVVEQLAGLEFERRVDLGSNDIWAMRFSGPDRTVDIIWSTGGTRDIVLTTSHTAITTIGTDGTRRDLSASGSVALQIGIDPLIVSRNGPELPGDDCRYFPETGNALCDRFLDFWERYGGLEIFGYPLSAQMQENGKTVQYLERMKFEHQPDAAGTEWEVVGELVGRTVTAGRDADGPFQPLAAGSPAAGCHYFAETGHRLCGGFRGYWEARGGLWMFGYPISEEFEERNPDTGQVYIVQYFERARFEWHPENLGTNYEVLVGRLGAQLFQLRYVGE